MKQGTTKLSKEQVGAKYGFRSGLEEVVARQIETKCGAVEYESTKIHYAVPSREASYTPDFILPNGIIIETKGHFIIADRKKHVLIKLQHPHLDIRFVFSNPQARISKKSKTTYGAWCDKQGFLYAKGSIPDEWFAE